MNRSVKSLLSVSVVAPVAALTVGISPAHAATGPNAAPPENTPTASSGPASPAPDAAGQPTTGQPTTGQPTTGQPTTGPAGAQGGVPAELQEPLAGLSEFLQASGLNELPGGQTILPTPQEPTTTTVEYPPGTVPPVPAMHEAMSQAHGGAPGAPGGQGAVPGVPAAGGQDGAQDGDGARRAGGPAPGELQGTLPAVTSAVGTVRDQVLGSADDEPLELPDGYDLGVPGMPGMG